eukprot:s6048_g2.t1
MDGPNTTREVPNRAAKYLLPAASLSSSPLIRASLCRRALRGPSSSGRCLPSWSRNAKSRLSESHSSALSGAHEPTTGWDRISAKKQRELAAQAKAEAEAKAQAEAEALAAEKAAAEQAAAEAKPAEDDVSKQEAVPMITEETAPAKQMEEVTAGEMEARVIRLGGGGC